MKTTLLDIAKACHEANAAYCASIGDDSQVPWDQAPDWQKESVLNGVALHVTDPSMPAEASHASWLAQKLAEGWKFGKTKDPKKKTHPSMVPFDELPEKIQVKDTMFKATVAGMRSQLGAGEIERAALRAADFHATLAEGKPVVDAPATVLDPDGNAPTKDATPEVPAPPAKSAEQIQGEADADHDAQAEAETLAASSMDSGPAAVEPPPVANPTDPA